MQTKKIGRFGAAATHLVICVLIAAAMIAVFWGVWYPHGLGIVAGASELLLIIVGVDIVVGPLLTLILFVPGKKGLYIDLAMIALLQIGALVGGAYVMLQTRPIFLVALPDRLQLVSANEINDADLAKASSAAFGHRSWTGPVLVGSKEPGDPALLWELTASVFGGGAEIDRRPQFYVAFDEVAKPLARRAPRLSKWRDSTEIGVVEAMRWITQQKLRAEDIAVVPVLGRSGTSAMLADANTGSLLRVFPFHPGVIAMESEPSPWALPNYSGREGVSQ